MIWFTADQHYGHYNVIKHDRRPFKSLEEMDETLISRWNERVKPDDVVWFLGDLTYKSAKPATYYISRLNGYIRFIQGNHDDTGRTCLQKTCTSLQLCHMAYVTINNQKIHMCHYPLHSWRAANHGSWHLYGHSHRELFTTSKRMCVSCNLWNYAPISFDEVAAFMSNRQIFAEHHADREPSSSL